jgi:toxin ParE1/3/4
MQVRWTTAAANDLENIADYLFEKTPENAARLIHEICDAVFALRIYPNRGRPGKKSGTRELVLPALPYIVVYKAGSEVLHIARILHGAQDWPR